MPFRWIKRRRKSRLAIVIVGKDAVAPSPQLFRKLAPHGVTLHNLQWTADTPQHLHAALQQHVGAQAAPYIRWYIDGGEPWPHDAEAVDLLSYAPFARCVKTCSIE